MSPHQSSLYLEIQREYSVNVSSMSPHQSSLYLEILTLTYIEGLLTSGRQASTVRSGSVSLKVTLWARAAVVSSR